MALRSLFFAASCASLVATPSFANPTIIIQTPSPYSAPVKAKPSPEQRYREAEMELLAPYEKAIEDENRRTEMKAIMGEVLDEKLDEKLGKDGKKPTAEPKQAAEPASPFGKIGGIGAVGGLGKVGLETPAQ